MKANKWLLAALAAGMALTAMTGISAVAEEEHYPGVPVYYREGDPQADVDVEITSDEKIEWTVAGQLAEDNPQSVALKDMAAELAEKTNGNFVLDIYYNAELGSENECVELCRNNTVQIVTSNPTTMAMYVDAAGAFALPYLFHAEEDALSYLATSENAYELWRELEEKTDLVTLCFQCSGVRTLSTKGVKKIKGPADLAGVKIRSMESEVWINVINSLGATAVPISWSELYTALQTGVVQGQENPPGHTVSGRFYEVLDTYYLNEHSYLISGIYANKNAWDELPEDYKALFLGLLQKYEGDQYHVDITAFTQDCLKLMEDAGLTIVPKEELDMDAFYESANKMIEEKYMSNEVYAALIEDVKATFNY